MFRTIFCGCFSLFSLSLSQTFESILVPLVPSLIGISIKKNFIVTKLSMHAQDELIRYYTQEFPSDEVCSSIFQPAGCLRYREFANTNRSEYQKRELCVDTPRALSQLFCTFVREASNPVWDAPTSLARVRVDAGAVYTGLDPSLYQNDEEASETNPLHRRLCLRRELVFDLDATDFDATPYPRTCGCVDRQICSVCWRRTIECGMFLSRVCSECFGLEQIFWFFSGQRGLHIYVCDEQAYQWSTETRQSLCTLLTNGGGETEGRINNDTSSTGTTTLSEWIHPWRPVGFTMDVPVTRQMQHLLKVPCSVHPGSGWVARPLYSEEIVNWLHETDTTLPFVGGANDSLVPEVLSAKTAPWATTSVDSLR